MSQAQLEIGHLFAGKYEVLALLGKGGFGAVYRACQINIPRDVALKVMLPGVTDPSMVERFRREAKHISQLRHPNTITLFDYGEEDGIYYIVMELLEGRDLATLIETEGALSVERAYRIVEQLLRSLAEAHRGGLIHRDLKPENVFIVDLPGEADFVKVLDFGIARGMGESQPEERLTLAGTVVGTPWYMAPEQALGREPLTATDVYAVGLILYEILTGRQAYDARSLYGVLDMQINAPVPELPGPLQGTPLAQIVRRACAKDPSARYADASEMLQALQREASGYIYAVLSGMAPALQRPNDSSALALSSDMVRLGAATQASMPPSQLNVPAPTSEEGPATSFVPIEGLGGATEAFDAVGAAHPSDTAPEETSGAWQTAAFDGPPAYAQPSAEPGTQVLSVPPEPDGATEAFEAVAPAPPTAPAPAAPVGGATEAFAPLPSPADDDAPGGGGATEAFDVPPAWAVAPQAPQPSAAAAEPGTQVGLPVERPGAQAAAAAVSVNTPGAFDGGPVGGATMIGAPVETEHDGQPIHTQPIPVQGAAPPPPAAAGGEHGTLVLPSLAKLPIEPNRAPRAEPAPPVMPHGEARFMGREDALAQLRRMCEQAARDGQARLVLLDSPTGMGKTRLVKALSRELSLGNTMTVVSGTYTQGDVPLSGLRAAITTLLRPEHDPHGQLADHAARVSAHHSGASPSLGLYLSEFFNPRVKAADPSGLDGPVVASLSAVIQAFWIEATRMLGPLCVVLDAFEHTDELTVYLLHELLARLAYEPRPLVWLIAMQADPLSGSAQVQEALMQVGLQLGPAFAHLPLTPLPEAHLTQVLHALAPIAPDACAQIVELSGGNTGVATQIYQDLCHTGDLTWDGAAWTLPDPDARLALPSALMDDTLDALDRLLPPDPDDAALFEGILQWLAILGDGSDKRTIRQALRSDPRGIPVDRLDAAVDMLTHMGLVLSEPHGRGVTLTHAVPIMRATMLADIARNPMRDRFDEVARRFRT